MNKKFHLFLFISILFQGSLAFSQTWITKAPMPSNVESAGAAVVNGTLYVIGGANGLVLTNNVSYSPQTNSWIQLAPMLTARAELVVASVNGKIYAIGGYNGSTYLNTVEEYNPVTNNWTTRSPMPTGRSVMSAAVINDKIYVVGGWNGGPVASIILEEYNPVTNIWTTLTPLPNPGRHQINSAFSYNGKLYLLGGKDQVNQTTYNLNSVYDPISNSWSSNTVLPQPLYAGAVSSAIGLFYYLGGTDHNSTYSARFNTNYIYNPITDQWTTGVPLPAKRARHVAASVNDVLYVIGGVDSAGNVLNSVLEFNSCVISNTITSSQTICNTTAPAPLSGSTPTGGTGTYAYQWESSSNQSSWASISGVTSRDYTPGLLNVNTYFRRIVTSGTCPGSTSTAVSVQIGSVSIIPSANTICSGQSISLTGNTTLMSPTQSPCTLSGLPSTLQNGLVGYWPFCGNANDVSGNGNHGTVNGATLTIDRFGNTNSAYSLANGNSITTSYNPANITKTTYSAWFKTMNGGVLIGSNASNITPNFVLAIHTNTTSGGNQGTAYWVVDNQGSSTGWMSLPPTNQLYTDNSWHHIVGVFSCANGSVIRNDSLSLYVDGQLITTIAQNVNPSTSPINILSNIVFGYNQRALSSGFDGRFIGDLDDIAIWNRELNHLEIQQLYSLRPIQYTWSTGASTSSISATPTTTTTYSLQVTSGTQTCAAQQVITVEAPPTPNILTGNQTICSNSIPIMLSGSLPTGGNGINVYQWESSSNQSIWASIPAATSRDYTPGVLNANTYFRRIVTSGTCPGSSSTAVSVQLGSVSIIASANTICAGQSITLTGNTTLNTTTQSPCTLSGLPSTLQNGLVGYWPFCGNANDASGNGNHGTVYGPVLTADRFGNANSAYSFDGVDDYINLPLNSGQLANASQFTIQYWLIPDSLISQPQTVFANWHSIPPVPTGSPVSYYTGYQNDGNFNVYSGFIHGYGVGTGSHVNFSSFDHVVIVYNGHEILTQDRQKVYLNGVLQSNNFSCPNCQLNIPGTIGNHFNHTTIGARFWGSNQIEHFKGKIDDLGIWNRTLSPQEIQQLYTLGSTQYTWSTSATTSTISASPSTTTTYSLQVTSGNQTCSAQQVITVQSPPTPNTLSGNQTICSNSIPAMLSGSTPTGGTGTYAYQWESSANQSTWASISGATARDYTPSLLNANTYFRRIVTSGVCAPSTSVSVAVQVDGMPMNNVVSGGQTLCAGTAAQMLTGSLPSGGVGGFTYQWESSSNNSIWSAVIASTTQNHNPGVVVQSVYFRRVVFSGSCTPSTSAGIYVQADAAVLSGNISSAQTLCSGNSANTLSGTQPSGGTGIYAYQWESSSNNLTWQILSAANQSTYAPGVVSQSRYYRRLVSSGVCTPGSSNAILIQVEFPSGNNIISSAQSICTGTQPLALSGSLPTGGSGLYQYQWQSSPDANTWFSISGATAPGHQPPVLNQSVWYRRVLSSGVCAPHTSLALAIQVQALPGNNTIQSNQTLCAGNTALTLTGALPSGGTGVYTYQWQSAPDNLTWVAMPSATNAGWNPGILTGDGYFRRVVSSGVCASVHSNSVHLRVEQALQQNVIGASQTLCHGQSAALLTGLIPVGGNGVYQYQWESGTDGMNWISTGNMLSAYSPGMVAGTTYFRRIVLSGVCPPVSSAAVALTAQPPITNNQVTGHQTLCSGLQPVTLNGTLPSGGSGVYDYYWESSLNQQAWQGIAGATARDYTPPALFANTYYRRVVQAGVCAPLTSQVISIGVQQTVGNNVITASQTLCAGLTPANLSGTIPTGGTGAYTYQWEQSWDGISWQNLSGATHDGYLPGNAMQNTYYRRLVSSGICGVSTGNSISIQVEHRLSNVMIYSSQTLCAGTAPNPLQGSQPSGGTGIYHYSWESSLNMGQWNPISGANQRDYAPGILQQHTYLRRVVSSGVCPSRPGNILTLQVDQPVLNNQIQSSQTICSSQGADVITGTLPMGGTGIYAYQWQSSSDAQNWFVIPGAQARDYQPGMPNGITYYRRSVASGICGQSVSAFVSVELGQAIQGNTLNGNQLLCTGTQPALIVGSQPSGGTGVYQYQWQSGTTPQIWSNIPGAVLADYQPQILSGHAYYRRVVLSGNCSPHTSASVSIIFTPQIQLNTISGAAPVCSGQSPGLLSGSQPAGGNGIYAYQWFSSTDSLNWQVISGGTGIDYMPVGITSNTYFRRQVQSGACTSISNASGVSMLPSPGIVSHPVDQAMHIGGTVQFSVTATGNGATYHWQTDTGQGFISMNNGGQYSGVATPVLSVSSLSMANQGQRFRCIVTLRSCKEFSNDAAIRIALDADTLAEIPVIMLYPNPNSGVFTIRLNQTYPLEDLRVRDMLGRDMPIQYVRESDEIRVQSSSLAKGNYTVSIIVAGSVVSKVFTVE